VRDAAPDCSGEAKFHARPSADLDGAQESKTLFDSWQWLRKLLGYGGRPHLISINRSDRATVVLISVKDGGLPETVYTSPHEHRRVITRQSANR
jgi:hypothetical protein